MADHDEYEDIYMELFLEILLKILPNIFIFLFLYQFVYLAVGFVRKLPRFHAKKEHRYAVLISAKNEERVIPHLIHSLKNQKYPEELLQIFVVADNCSDRTAEVSREAGAVVFERHDEINRGKGYALRYLLNQIDALYGLDAFDGYLVFDADNLVDKNYIREINKVFDSGYRIVTSYRNSKNYGSNWISAGTGLWFLRESKYINNPRMQLGTSCMVSGTGFLMHKDVVKANGGWNFFLLTEDAQFSVDSILKGEKIGYCENAIFYDEQPLRFRDSWNQRLRWTGGFYQVFYRYGRQLFRRLFHHGGFTFYDILITLTPGFVFLGSVALIAILTIFDSGMNVSVYFRQILQIVIETLITSYALFFAMGGITTFTEWHRIYCTPAKKIAYMFTFPIFMFTYVPLAIAALFVKIRWKPIAHDVSISAEELRKQKESGS
jgi:cellulose synthase/poly-beta-1,6-N-acetylglucosamine synthase-like glycosyltransferase